ncbi:uncharacterized protein L203_100209 [Cryptococcus depauperatus CBS 7841]|uniref:Uncharacterized protein n=1 Tax=Cryptococcus depauperatus CBS 7841 TaxID=1295531 RepID=A0A1E3IZE2_9TREE|nr:hypothetical protein L203_00132 [Cryptococcus depauperatus CBS 7841]ODN99867.1 hypothetical protein L204_02307 [Cryptococcus depauperatus CBS 7855]
MPAPGKGEDDVALPKATVVKIIQEMLPDDISASKEAKDIIFDCCTEWIKLISTQSNMVCEASSKKTISPEHVMEALKQLGFEDFLAEVEESHTDFKQAQKERIRTQPDTQGMTEEELMELQERLFASSHARFAGGQ